VYQSTLGVSTVSGSDNSHFDSPYGVAFDSSSNIYVADQSNHRVQIFNSAGVYQSTLGVSTVSGSDNSHFDTPIGVAVDSSKNLYVADENNHRVQKFTSPNHAPVANNDKTTTPVNTPVTIPVLSNDTDADSNQISVSSFTNGTHGKVTSVHTYLSQFGSYGSGNGQFASPFRVGTDSSGNIYVADSDDNRVEKFNSTGVYISQFGTPGSGNGQFNALAGIALDSSGNIYVVDNGNNRIQKFNFAGTYQSQFGTPGSGNGQFDSPLGIVIDASGNIYVTDLGHNRVEKFNSAGTYQSQFGSYGSGNGQFDSPTGIALDSSGNIYVLDHNNNRVEKFNSAGTYQSQFGSSGSGNGQFNTPYDVFIDSSDHIYVADYGNNRIQVFNYTGNYLSQFGSSGSGNGQFDSPTGITIDNAANVYVTDHYNNRIEKFRNDLKYTPNSGFAGSDSFTYIISDGHGATSSATVNVKLFLPLTDSVGITDQLSYVFTSTSIVGSGGTAKTQLPGGTTASIKLPAGQSGTVTIQTTTAPTTGSGSSTLGFVGTVTDITPPANSCAVLGCVFSFNFTSAQVTAAGLTDPSQVVIFHDHNNDGDFKEAGETLATTITTVSPGHFTATATDFFTSKFAIGGVVTALAVLGHGGNSGSSQAFSADGFINLRTLSQSAKDSIRNEDPYVALKPSNDPTVPYYPFSLDGNNYLIARYANTIQTVTEKVGVPINLQLASPDTTISHIALYTNMEGLGKEIGDSDTYVVYDKGSPLQLVDPHGYFSNVKITTTTDSNNIEKFVFTMTFAKPMPTSNIFIREWDETKYSSDTKIKDAIQIIESPQNIQTSKDLIPAKIISQAALPIPPATSDDVTNYIKQWAGYSSTSISDSELLDHFGIKGDHIPSWFMKSSKWLVSGDTSQQEFKEAIKYMSDKSIIK